MEQFTIGILKESKTKEQRVPLIPADASVLLNQFPFLRIKAEPSEIRVYSDEQFRNAGVEISNDFSNCDLIVGLKEIKIDKILPHKTYLFFAHVAKMQASKKKYFRQLACKNITLIDYEYLTNKNERRIAAFGYWAGIAAVYNAYYAIGKRYQCFELPLSSAFNSSKEMINLLNKVNVPPLKMIITGSGNSAKGVSNTLTKLGIKSVSPSNFKNRHYQHSVFCMLSPRDYLINTNGNRYSKTQIKANPGSYYSVFHEYALAADVYFACHYWQKEMPELLSNKHLANNNSRLKIVADVSCDINGPIACTVKETSINNPFYDFDPITRNIEPAFSSEKNISVMAVGNLPSMLPFDSSDYFSEILTKSVFPQLITKKESEIINNATLLSQGKLTFAFRYLDKYLNS